MADVITRFKLETTQYDSKLRDATTRLRDLVRNVQVAGGSLNDLSKEDKELAKSFGSLDIGAKNAKDAVRELVGSFNTLARQYYVMTEEMQQSDVGKMMASQMDVLRDRIKDAKKELYDMGDSMKGAASDSVNFGKVLEGVASQLGINTKLLSGLTSGTIATTAAVTAGAAAVAAATKMWADYNDQLNRQTVATTVTTGLKGSQAEDLTVGVRALSRTYDVEFRDAINAANTLMQQFGVTGEQALSLLQDGMQGMLAGDGNKLLNMIQQYAPSFRDAGVEASQLIAIIQNSEGGLFTDQNMQAIALGIRNIRRMTKETSDALAELGINGQQMSRQLNEGSMSVFDALRQVSSAIDSVESGSKVAGDVLQAVFGRSGYQAGTKLGEAIETLNLNLEETKRQTGELGESFVELNEANIRLEKTMKDLFGMTGWEDMSNTIKTELANALSDAMDYLINIREALYNIGTSDSFDTLAEAATRFSPALYPVLKGLAVFSGMLEDIKERWNGLFGGGEEKSAGENTFKTIGTRLRQATQNAIQASGIPQNLLPEVVVTPTKPKEKPKGGGGGKSGSNTSEWSPINMSNFNRFEEKSNSDLIFSRSLTDVNADIAKAQKMYNDAGDAFGRAAAQSLLKNLQQERTNIISEGDVTKGGLKDAYTHDFGKDMAAFSEDLRAFRSEDGVSFKESFDKVAKTMQGVSQIASGLEGLGVDMPDEIKELISIIQSAMAVVQGVQTVMEVVNASATSANTIAVAANTVAIGALTTALSVNTASNFIPFFRHGGLVPKAATGMVIPGNDFADKTPVLASAGELILNKSQQANLASLLNEVDKGAGRSGGGTAYVKGEEILLVLNNVLRRSGRGELVTTRRQ